MFQIRAPDCGDLQKIRLYHDNSGLGPAWHCEIVIVSACRRPRNAIGRVGVETTYGVV